MRFRTIVSLFIGLSVAAAALVADQPSAAQFTTAEEARLASGKPAQAKATETGEADLKAAWDAARSELEDGVWTVEAAGFSLSLGDWDRNKKQWDLIVVGQYMGFPVNLQFIWNIAQTYDPKRVYDQVNAFVKAKALGCRIIYHVSWQGGSQWRAEQASLEVVGKNEDGSEMTLESFLIDPMVGHYDFAATSPDEVSKVSFIDLVAVTGGSFTMGSPMIQAGRRDNEVEHAVTVSGFRIGKTEITQVQYQAVMGRNPSYFSRLDNAPRHPVEQVSWYDALAFCNKLSAMEGLSPAYEYKGMKISHVATATGYRLPTEAEWEYAARGGAMADGTLYAGSVSLGEAAWFYGNSDQWTHPFGQLKANGLGLVDMSGNIWEWCYDWYGDYPTKAGVDPVGGTSGPYRVLRGGSWGSAADYCTVSNRNYNYPNYRHYYVGFRVVAPASP
ncbi:MAG: formylglycine-generating enzyme family protein [Spirochaetota bacterium]